MLENAGWFSLCYIQCMFWAATTLLWEGECLQQPQLLWQIQVDPLAAALHCWGSRLGYGISPGSIPASVPLTHSWEWTPPGLLPPWNIPSTLCSPSAPPPVHSSGQEQRVQLTTFPIPTVELGTLPTMAQEGLTAVWQLSQAGTRDLCWLEGIDLCSQYSSS